MSAGKSLLRRRRASEALVRLERALALYRQGGRRSGEAAARDLLGELYERQGQYEVALEHFRQAHEIFVGGAAETERAKSAAAAGSRPPPAARVVTGGALV